jgi:segregation and condensation protein A
MPYEVQTPVFEGPFDLLLHLILKEEVDLWEISLARIVDAYLTEVDKLGAIDLETATEFLLIAATLVELKARRLLPGRDDVDLDEELARFEERDLLLARLLECKTFQDAAQALHTRMLEAGKSYARFSGPEEPFRSLEPDPLERSGLAVFARAANRALTPKALPANVDTEHVAPVRASVRDAIETVLALLPDRGALRFRDLVAGVTERLEVIVRFLAVLELFKQGIVDLEQPANFAELVVRPLEPGERASLDLASIADWEDDEPRDAVVDLTDDDDDDADADDDIAVAAPPQPEPVGDPV